MMSMLASKISKLQRFVSENPSLANVPFLVVHGKAITPIEALSMFRSGINVASILKAISEQLDIDPESVNWKLAEEFFKRVAAAGPEAPKIYSLQLPPITPMEALEHIRRRDEIGKMLVESYKNLLRHMKVKLEE